MKQHMYAAGTINGTADAGDIDREKPKNAAAKQGSKKEWRAGIPERIA